MTLNQAFTWRSRINKYISNSIMALSTVSDVENLFGGENTFETSLTEDKIKEQIDKVNNKKVKNFLVNGKNTFAEEFEKVEKLSNFSVKLQEAIDSANISSGALSTMHQIQALQTILKIVTARANVSGGDQFSSVEERKVFSDKEYNPDTKALGAYRYTYMFPTADAGILEETWEDKKEELSKKIRDLTDSLSEINGSTRISNKFFTDEEFEEVKNLI